MAFKSVFVRGLGGHTACWFRRQRSETTSWALVRPLYGPDATLTRVSCDLLRPLTGSDGRRFTWGRCLLGVYKRASLFQLLQFAKIFQRWRMPGEPGLKSEGLC